jgi:hypothetical protein
VTVSGDNTGVMCALQLMQPCALYGSCVPHLGATCAIRKPCGINGRQMVHLRATCTVWSCLHHMGALCAIWKVDDTMWEPPVPSGGNLAAI